jgi:hypothetical protein
LRCAKARPLITPLSRNDAVEADGAIAEIAHRSVPDAQTEAAPSELRTHDAEPDETKGVIVGDRRDAADRLVIEQAEKKAVRIGVEEWLGVTQSRIPSFARRPLNRQVQLSTRHATHGEAAFRTVHPGPPLRRSRGTPSGHESERVFSR